MQGFNRAPKRSFFPLCSFVSFVVCLFIAGCAGSPRHPAWSNATGAGEYERLMWKAIQEKEWNTVERRMSATFVGVNPEGQGFDRAGWLAYWKSASIREFVLGEVSVQPEGPDMKVTYVLQFHSDGSKSAAGSRVVSVWQQINTRWTLTATAMTPIQ
jgi:hypothetical protein